jgi:hypothetical protein
VSIILKAGLLRHCGAGSITRLPLSAQLSATDHPRSRVISVGGPAANFNCVYAAHCRLTSEMAAHRPGRKSRPVSGAPRRCRDGKRGTGEPGPLRRDGVADVFPEVRQPTVEASQRPEVSSRFCEHRVASLPPAGHGVVFRRIHAGAPFRSQHGFRSHETGSRQALGRLPSSEEVYVDRTQNYHCRNVNPFLGNVRELLWGGCAYTITSCTCFEKPVEFSGRGVPRCWWERIPVAGHLDVAVLEFRSVGRVNRLTGCRSVRLIPSPAAERLSCGLRLPAAPGMPVESLPLAEGCRQ